MWAIPAGGMSWLMHWLWYDVSNMSGFENMSAVGAVWSSFTFILGFLIVFRAQQAYARYWEGATLVQQARANFFNCCSNLIAFCSGSPDLRDRVEEFQHLLVRLVSMLQCVGLQTVADMEDVRFQFFNTDGLDKESLRFLSSKNDKHQRCEIIAQWIQRHIINASRSGIIDVPPPILTRCFQELSQGLVHIINARIMTGIPFPFPYAQMLALLLVIHWLVTPLFCALILQSAVWSSVLTFLCTLAFWGTNYIAAEIESPFGEDANDLPLFALQKDMNASLWVLLHSISQRVPTFAFDKERHRKWDVVCAQNFDFDADRLRRSSTNMWMRRKSQTKMTVQSSLHGVSSHLGEHETYYEGGWKSYGEEGSHSGNEFFHNQAVLVQDYPTSVPLPAALNLLQASHDVASLKEKFDSLLQASLELASWKKALTDGQTVVAGTPVQTSISQEQAIVGSTLKAVEEIERCPPQTPPKIRAVTPRQRPLNSPDMEVSSRDRQTAVCNCV
jgi:predicted membrane chloride channel (bestrophin family)